MSENNNPEKNNPEKNNASTQDRFIPVEDQSLAQELLILFDTIRLGG